MHARWRVIAPWICVVGVLGALWLPKLSPSYKQCDAHEKQYAATEKARNSQEERARRFVICEGAFVDANREAITAAATVAIAAFTLVLWLATSRQARLTAQTIALARDEFNATHRPRIRVRHVTLDRLYDKDS